MRDSQINTLLQHSESEWLEFKKDNFTPEEIGKNISAISNSIPLLDRQKGYIIWGVDNNHKVLGTKFQPTKEKVRNQELENWLLTQLRPQINFTIHEKDFKGKKIVIIEIPHPTNQPIRFKETEYIRIGSYTKKLRDHPEKERVLWSIFQSTSFEERLAIENINSEKILRLLDFANYFKKKNELLPESHTAILDRLASDKIIVKKNETNTYGITNLGAILFCNDLEDFPQLIRRAPRVISYEGTSRIDSIREKEFTRGYALDFDKIIEYIDIQVPKNEEIERAFRKETSMYPILAIRELVANALIHQDFNSRGNLLIEIFSNRIEISNSGKPLIDTLRFIDEAPSPRNENLVRMMRKLKIAEDRGTGIDKVIFQIELYQLPAPDFRTTENSTIITLYGIRKFSAMTSEERVRACYQHACLCWVSSKSMTNETLRERFKLKKEQYPAVHKILADTLKKELIKKEGTARWTKYKPYWT